MTTLGDWHPKYNEHVIHIKGESDRAAAVLMASFMEHFATEKLKGYFIQDSAVSELCASHGALGSFGALMEVAYALGLMTRAMRSDLKYIRKIRNLFAHHHDVIDFNSPKIQDLCSNLTTAKGIPTLNSDPLKFESPRDQYMFALSMWMTYFERFIHSRERCQIPSTTTTPG